MNCRKTRHAIQSYVDGSVTRAERDAVDAHVMQCPACARELEESRQLRLLLSGMPARRVSDDFERNLQAAISNTAPASANAAWWEHLRFRFEWRLRVPALVTAGTLAAGIAAAIVMPSYVRHQQAAEQREQLVYSAVERHQQLEQANPSSNWEAVESSIELTTGSIVVE